jgi:glutamate carboxypeptidase
MATNTHRKDNGPANAIVRRAGGLAAGAALLVAVAPALAAPAARNARLWAAAEAARPAQLALLEQVVDIDSGTGDAPGGGRVADVLVPKLEALGMSVRRVPAEAPGLADNIVATLAGSGKGRVLMIGHLDTVFGPGTVAQRPFRIVGERAMGPGVSDEKGGVVEGLLALQLLGKLGFHDYARITLLIESSEERGSPGTRRLIDELLRDADVELNLEPGDPPDALTTWRKGSSSFEVRVHGRAAHAGVAPQDGRNAAEELIHQVQSLPAFPKSGDGLTVNLTLMSAGSRANIIPEDASATYNVRIREKSQADDVARALAEVAAHPLVPDTKVTVVSESSFPPLPTNPATEALADRAATLYAGLGLSLARGGNGGASESALAAEAGVPALDGLGPVGGGFHSDAEYLELRSLTPRLYLLAALLMDVGHAPPARSVPAGGAPR